MTQNSSHTPRRRLQGTVVSTAMSSTAVVRVDRRVAHKKYGKYYTVSKKFHVHNPETRAHKGDVIVFEECHPISKTKRWRYVETIKAFANRELTPTEDAVASVASIT